MALPRQVQRQADLAAKIEQDLANPPNLDQNATPEPPAAPEPTPEPQPVVEPPKPADDPIKQAHEVLKGKYNAEVPKLLKENRDLKATVANLIQDVEALRTRPQEEAKPQPVAGKDVEDFGLEMVEMVRRVATDLMQAEAQKVLGRLTAIENALKGVDNRQQMTDQERFVSKVTELVSDWMAINKDQRFLDWLLQEDELTGATRQYLLDAATDRMDPARVAAIFNAFKKEHMAPKPQNDEAEARSRSQQERQLSPPKGGSTAAQAPAPKEVWTDAGIEAFYSDIRKGKFVGKEAEQQRIEADLHQALAEGRYRK